MRGSHSIRLRQARIGIDREGENASRVVDAAVGLHVASRIEYVMVSIESVHESDELEQGQLYVLRLYQTTALTHDEDEWKVR